MEPLVFLVSKTFTLKSQPKSVLLLVTTSSTSHCLFFVACRAHPLVSFVLVLPLSNANLVTLTFIFSLTKSLVLRHVLMAIFTTLSLLQ